MSIKPGILRLNSETIRHLGDLELGAAEGGIVTNTCTPAPPTGGAGSVCALLSALGVCTGQSCLC